MTSLVYAFLVHGLLPWSYSSYARLWGFEDPG